MLVIKLTVLRNADKVVAGMAQKRTHIFSRGGLADHQILFPFILDKSWTISPPYCRLE